MFEVFAGPNSIMRDCKFYSTIGQFTWRNDQCQGFYTCKVKTHSSITTHTHTHTDIGFERLLARERVWNISKITKADLH